MTIEQSPLPSLVARHVDGANLAAVAAIARTVARFGEPLARFVFAHGVRIRVLDSGESYRAASPAIARAVSSDAWPHPPAGLFVVPEKTVYLRRLTPMSVAHEFAHAVDCALGDGRYFSSRSPAVRAAFACASGFVTPYAAIGLDEYFAECVRAFVGVNDAASRWPRVSNVKLKRCDPRMHAILRPLVAAPRALV